MTGRRVTGTRAVLAVAAVAALALGACGGGDDDAEGDDDAAPTTTTTPPAGGDDDGGGDDGDGGDDGGDGGDGDGSGAGGGDGAGEAPSVFGLPAGGSYSEFLPYELIDDEFARREFVSLLVEGLEIEEVLEYFETTLPGMGYEVGPRLPLGESFALNITDPTNPNVSAVVQVGPDPDGGLILTQEKTELKDQPGDDASGDDEPAGGTTGSAGDGGVSEGTDDEGGDALDTTGDQAAVDWGALPSTPYFAATAGNTGPYFHIHTNPATDGFFLSFEMYVDWGQAWTGQTGTFDITCNDPTTSTGICPYFDPDGPGPMDVLGADFMTTGSMTINALGEGGYDIVVHDLMFSDGTSFSEFTMTG